MNEDEWTGKNVFIRTLTYHFTGRVKRVTASEIWLEDVAWIADSGRWADGTWPMTLGWELILPLRWWRGDWTEGALQRT